jgi:hypothetical protein
MPNGDHKLPINQLSVEPSERVFDEDVGHWVDEPAHQSAIDLDDNSGTGGFRVPAAGNPDEMGYDRCADRTFKGRSPDLVMDGLHRHGLRSAGFHIESGSAEDLPRELDDEDADGDFDDN